MTTPSCTSAAARTLLEDGGFSILDVTPTVLKLMNIAAPPNMDGRSLL